MIGSERKVYTVKLLRKVIEAAEFYVEADSQEQALQATKNMIISEGIDPQMLSLVDTLEMKLEVRGSSSNHPDFLAECYLKSTP